MSSFLPHESISWAMRLFLAQGVIFLFLLLNIVSFSMPHAGDFKPFFLLMAVYYWAIYRPTVMPVFYTFILGIVMDLQTGLPVGLSALVMISIQIIVRRSRLFLMGQSYVTVWIGFAVIALINALFLWLVISLVSYSSSGMMPLLPSLVAAGLSVLLFPLASLVLQAVHRVLPVSSKPLHSVG